MTAHFQNNLQCFAVIKHFLVVLAASLVLTRIELEDVRGVNYPHEIPIHDYTLYREHDILFTSPAFYFGPPAIHVFLNSRIILGVKPIFRLCPSLVSSQPSPPKLDFGSAWKPKFVIDLPMWLLQRPGHMGAAWNLL